MAYPHGGLAVWFGRGKQQDGQYLYAWRSAPLTYSPESELDANWCADRYEVILGQDMSGVLYRRAAELTLRNKFYPAQVMTAVSDFDLEARPVRAGDRVLQRIRILQYEGLPLLEMLTLNQITEVIEEPRKVGFTYTTTAAHSEVGEWSPRVEWRENGEVALVIEVVSCARPDVPAFMHRLIRRMQLRAHKLSIQNFVTQLTGSSAPLPKPSAVTVPRIAPIGLLLVAILLFFGVTLASSRKQE